MNHPAIFHLGQVIDDGETITVRGWMLSTCSSGCRCHEGADGRLTIAAGDDGSLGLKSYRECGCCVAWTVEELQAVLRDVSDVQTVVDARSLEATG